MFDIGFWELATIAIIGIVVVGPERLPEVVRTVAAYVRKARRAFQDVKSDIERELDLDDLRRQMHELDMDEHIQKLNQSVMDADRDIRKAVSRFDDDTHHHAADSLREDLNDPEVRAGGELEYDSDDYDRDAHRADEYADTGVEGDPIAPQAAPRQRTDAPDSSPAKKHD